MLNTNAMKIADKVQNSFSRWKKAAIAEQLGITYPTLRKRLKDNFWQPSEVETLKKMGIL